MKKILLSETSLYGDYLPNISNVNKEDVKKFAMKEIASNAENLNNYQEYSCGFNKNLNWISWYIRNKLSAKHKITLDFMGQYLLKQDHNESTLKRNHLDFYSSTNTPDFITVYFMDNSSNFLELEYDDHRHKNLNWTVPVEQNKCITFNSDINFYFSKNKEKEILTHYIIKWHQIK